MVGAITSALGGSSSNDGVQVGTEDITIGKKEEETAVDTQIGDSSESTQTANEIINTINQSGITTGQLLLIILLAGWAIPDPITMFRGLLRFITVLLPWGWRARGRTERHEGTPYSPNGPPSQTETSRDTEQLQKPPS